MPRFSVAPLFVACAFAAPALAVSPQSLSIGVDGHDQLRFSAVTNTLAVHHLSWSHPSNLTIDGSAKPLSFTNNVSALIAVPIAGDYWVKKTAGRDGAYAVQLDDGFMLTADDNPNGADTYAFQFAAAPADQSFDWMHVRATPTQPANALAFPNLPGYVPQPFGTVTTITLTVDGTEELLFHDGTLSVRHLAWDAPSSVTINGTTQALSFVNNASNTISLTLPDHFVFTQLAGRSPFYPVETPAGLLIAADDELVGTDTYTFTITAIPEPASLAACGLALLSLLRRRASRS